MLGPHWLGRHLVPGLPLTQNVTHARTLQQHQLRGWIPQTFMMPYDTLVSAQEHGRNHLGDPDDQIRQLLLSASQPSRWFGSPANWCQILYCMTVVTDDNVS